MKMFPHLLVTHISFSCHNPMPSGTMEVDDFEAKTNAFVSWLSNVGVIMNLKMGLVDLRA
jgi:hypothetical protein